MIRTCDRCKKKHDQGMIVSYWVRLPSGARSYANLHHDEVANWLAEHPDYGLTRADPVVEPLVKGSLANSINRPLPVKRRTVEEIKNLRERPWLTREGRADIDLGVMYLKELEIAYMNGGFDAPEKD